MAEQVVTSEIAAKILEMYQAGEKISTIEDNLGVSRSSIYYTLEKAAVAPNRAKRGRRLRGDDHDLVRLYVVIEAQEARIAYLEQTLQEAGVTFQKR